MANTINKKQNLAMQALLKRQDYLVTQGNDLARAFGNLTSFEHKVLDYCFSWIWCKQSKRWTSTQLLILC